MDEIESATEGLLLAVQILIDLTFPEQLVANVARLKIEIEIFKIKEETVEVFKNSS